ncbi:MAG: hypothetical protein NTU83_10950, partial [Candidatus Hydrogenedentes bacterium]|nr:hypothetical protein [Candidatus Hydrogenedentota bacterium]
MENTRFRGMRRRTFLTLGGTGVAVAGMSVLGYRSRKKPDLPESIGKLLPNENAPCPTAPMKPKDIEDLGIRHMSELDRLQWFKKNEAGEICLRPDAGIGPIIDTHSHLGWAYGLGQS